MELPKQYSWILQESGTKMVQEFVKIYGVLETPGDADNPVILNWAKEVGLDKVYKHDATAWCALCMAVLAKRAGKEIPKGPLWALNWANFGEQVTDGPKFGDVIVLKRKGGGHVGLYLCEDAECIHLGAGNQGDRVSISRVPWGRIYAIRRPHYNIQPACVRKIILSDEGEINAKED